MSQPLVPPGVRTTLRTPRLKLRMLDPEDDDQCSALLSVTSDPTAGQIGNNRNTELRSLEALRTKHRVNGPQNRPEWCTITAPPRGMFHLIYLPGSTSAGEDEQDQLIGMIGVNFRRELPWPDLGYGVKGAFEGKGYATEAAEEVFRFWRDDVGIRNMVICTLMNNVKSQKVAEKLGFVEGGDLKVVFGSGPDEKDNDSKGYLLPGMTWVNGLRLKADVGQD